jgi:phenylalanyl-tRNA synthetase beta chain
VGSLLDILQRNVQRGERSLQIFEFGKVYLKDFEDLLRCERGALGLAYLGNANPHWSESVHSFDFYDAIGVAEALFLELGLREETLESFECEYFHPGQSGRWVCASQVIGVVGSLHPKVSQQYDLPTDPILMEVDIQAMLSLLHDGAYLRSAATSDSRRMNVQTPSPFPPIRRDLSLTVSKDTSVREIIELIDSNRPELLEMIHLFDRYTGNQIGEDSQSLGFRLTYRSAERTLTEEEITPIHLALLKTLNEQIGAVQRGMSFTESKTV